MNKKIIATLTTALVFGTVFAASFGAGFAMQIKNAEPTSFTIGSAPVEVTTKIYYQSSFFYGGEGKVYAYAWNSVNTNEKNAPYPGVEMTAEDYKHGLYSYEVSDKYDKIIFNADGGETDPTKTGDLTINRTNVYYCQHENEWNATLNDCTFSYYLVGNLSGADKWHVHEYENGLLKNYSGNNVSEYLKADYTFKKGDEFQIVSKDESSWYGVGGTKGAGNYKVAMANSTNKTAYVYCTPGSNLYSGVDFYFHNPNSGVYGFDFWCHHWIEGGSTTNWPGIKMNVYNQNNWYCANVSLDHDKIIFHNNKEGQAGSYKTNTLPDIDYANPYFDQTWKSSM